MSQVERGIRSVDRLSVILDMARVLQVEPEALAGRPWQCAPNGSTIADGLADVRWVFARYEHLIGQEPPAAPALPQLRRQVAETHRVYQAARYDDVIAMLPGLLTGIESLSRPANGTERRESLLSYVSAYVVAAKLVTKLGAADLAILAADRAAQVAVEADSPAARGMAGYQVACALLRADQTDNAEHVAVGLAESLEPHVRSDDPEVISLAGALWLIGAVVAARRTDRWEADTRLDRAQTLADLIGHDANHAWTAFGPTNVAIHRVTVVVELGDASDALRVAVNIDPTRLPKGLASRRAQVNLDLAWAQAQRKRDAEATLHLLEAERVAPEVIKHNVIAQEVVREMLARGNRTQTTALANLASRAGLLH